MERDVEVRARECQLFIWPVVLNGGKPALPIDTRVELLDERRFSNGVVHLRYRLL